MSTATARYERLIETVIDPKRMPQDAFDVMYQQVMGAFQKTSFVRQQKGDHEPTLYVPENQLYGARVNCFKTLLYHAHKNREEISEELRGDLVINTDRVHPARFWIQGPNHNAVSLELNLYQNGDEPNVYTARTRFWKDGENKDICTIPLDRRKNVYSARAREAALDAYRRLGMPGKFE